MVSIWNQPFFSISATKNASVDLRRRRLAIRTMTAASAVRTSWSCGRTWQGAIGGRWYPSVDGVYFLRDEKRAGRKPHGFFYWVFWAWNTERDDICLHHWIGFLCLMVSSCYPWRSPSRMVYVMVTNVNGWDGPTGTFTGTPRDFTGKKMVSFSEKIFPTNPLSQK